MAAAKPLTISISVDENGNITVSPTAAVVRVGQRVEWIFPDERAKAMLLVFYEGNPIEQPILRAKGREKATGRAANQGIHHYQVVVAKAGAPLSGGDTEVDLYADTGCPTIIVE